MGQARGRWRNPMVGMAVAVLAVGLAVSLAATGRLVLHFSFDRAVSSSMAPALKPGTRVATEHVDPAELHRGDVVVYSLSAHGMGPGAAFSRVVAVGGDEVSWSVADGLALNGKPYPEPYLSGPPADGVVPFSVQVPPGRFFLMGDHRDDSLDSRFFRSDGHQGAVDGSAILGRVVWTSEGSTGTPVSSSFGTTVTVAAGGWLLLVLGGIGLPVALAVAARRHGPVIAPASAPFDPAGASWPGNHVAPPRNPERPGVDGGGSARVG